MSAHKVEDLSKLKLSELLRAAVAHEKRLEETKSQHTTSDWILPWDENEEMMADDLEEIGL